MKKKYIIIGIIIFVFILGIKYIPFGTHYTTKTVGKLEVPRLSILKEECCMFNATFKSFRSTNILKHELDKIMNKYEKKKCNGKTCYYDKENDITITEYGVQANFPLNEFYIAYDRGQIFMDNDDSNISLSLKEETLTNKGLSFVIKNNTDKEYWCGEEYTLEKFENNKWIEVDTLSGQPLSWNAIAYTLKPTLEKEINIDWSLEYGTLKNGKYRLGKTVFKEEDRPIDDSKLLHLYVEFDIK